MATFTAYTADNAPEPAKPSLTFETVRARPETIRAYAKGEPYASRPAATEESKKILCGQTAARPKAV